MSDNRLNWTRQEIQDFYEFSYFATAREEWDGLQDDPEYCRFLAMEERLKSKGKFLIYCDISGENHDIVDVNEFINLTNVPNTVYSIQNFFPSCFHSFKEYFNYTMNHFDHIYLADPGEKDF